MRWFTTEQEWKRYEAQGKRKFLANSLEFGLLIGVVCGMSTSLLAGPRAWNMVFVLSNTLEIAGITAIASLLVNLCRWQLLQRKFSRK